MSTKEQDSIKQQEASLHRGINGYGAYISGKTEKKRRQVLLPAMDEPVIVECEAHSDAESIFRHIVETTKELDLDPEQSIGGYDASLGLVETDMGIALLNFDLLPKKERTKLAQWIKGLAEKDNFNGHIGFTGNEPGAVVRAEPEMRARIPSIHLD